MLDLAFVSKLNVSFSSNAIILNKKIADTLLEYPFERIEFSMDGFNKEEFLKGKQVDKYQESKDNILYFLKKAKEKKVKTKFNVHFVDIGNVSFLNKKLYIKFWKKQLKGLNHKTSFFYEPHNWAGTRDYAKKEIGLLDTIFGLWELKKPCVYIKGININWNGDILICANNPTKTAIIGNINEEKLEDIYNGKKRMEYLSEHEKGSFRDLNCSDCTVNSIFPLLFIKKRIIIWSKS